MGKASNIDFLAEACNNGDLEACETLRRKRMAAYGMKDGGLLADASRTWRMESDYPEFEKGIADRLSKERVPEAEIEEQFNYSPLQRGYAEGGEVDFDTEGSMLDPEIPLNFEEDYSNRREASDFPAFEEEISAEGEEDILTDLSPEDEEILFQALSDYPELEEILNKLGAIMSPSMDVFDEEGSVEGPGTGTSDSIPANLSDGEFVFTAKAVKQLGVDKLRKMMAKAEEDYNDGDAEQMIAQMGDEGFAAGGLLTRADYFAGGGNVNYEDIPIQGLFEDRLFEGREFSLGQIISMSRKKRFGENFLSKVSRIGKTNKYRVKGMKYGGEVYDLEPGSYGFSDEGTRSGEGTPGLEKHKLPKYLHRTGNPHKGEEPIMGKERPILKKVFKGLEMIDRPRRAVQEGLGTILYKLLGLDPVTFIKGRDGKPAVHRESSKFTET